LWNVLTGWIPRPPFSSTLMGGLVARTSEFLFVVCIVEG
jgi:hypothetical protein